MTGIGACFLPKSVYIHVSDWQAMKLRQYKNLGGIYGSRFSNQHSFFDSHVDDRDRDALLVHPITRFRTYANCRRKAARLALGDSYCADRVAGNPRRISVFCAGQDSPECALCSGLPHYRIVPGSDAAALLAYLSTSCRLYPSSPTGWAANDSSHWSVLYHFAGYETAPGSIRPTGGLWRCDCWTAGGMDGVPAQHEKYLRSSHDRSL